MTKNRVSEIDSWGINVSAIKPFRDRDTLMGEYRTAIGDTISVWGRDFRRWPKDYEGTVVFTKNSSPEKPEEGLDKRVLKVSRGETKRLIEQLENREVSGKFVHEFLDNTAEKTHGVKIVFPYYIEGGGYTGYGIYETTNVPYFKYGARKLLPGKVELIVDKHSMRINRHPTPYSTQYKIVELTTSDLSEIVGELNKSYISPKFLNRFKEQKESEVFTLRNVEGMEKYKSTIGK